MVYHLQYDTEDILPNNTTSPPSTNKQTNNCATNYAQTLPEGTTNTVPILADKHKTVRSCIIQYEETRDFNRRRKGGFPHYIVYVNQLSLTTIIQQVDTVTVKSACQVNA